MQSFDVVTTIGVAPDVAFDLARDMGLHAASVGRGNERPVAGVIHGLIGPGEQVTLRATHFGVRFTLTSRVTAFDRPRRFVDEQVRGPLRSWHHTHDFEAAPAGTVMTDRIRFAAPFGPLGWLVERLVLRRYLRRLITHRAAWLKAEAERRHHHERRATRWTA